MARVLRLFPGIAEGPQIRRLLDRHLSAQRLGRELEYFELERNRTFERPYGWGWLLRLAAELLAWDDPDARRWSRQRPPALRSIGGLVPEVVGQVLKTGANYVEL